MMDQKVGWLALKWERNLRSYVIDAKVGSWSEETPSRAINLANGGLFFFGHGTFPGEIEENIPLVEIVKRLPNRGRRQTFIVKQ